MDDPELARILEGVLSARTKDEIEQAVQKVVAALPSEYKEETAATMLRKRSHEHLLRHIAVLGELFDRGKPIVAGETLEERYAQYLSLVAHVEALWDDAVLLFGRGRYASALFFSVVVLEETGKVGAARFQLVGPIKISRDGLPERTPGHPYYSHTKKHLLAAGAGAAINSRLDRILGEDAVIEFLDAVESGEVEALRQKALYADHDGSAPVLPADHVTEELARRYMVLSGEILAEVLGWAANDWSRLLAKVESFEKSVGLG